MPPQPKKPETRAEAAHRINLLRAEGKLSPFEWSDLFDAMSNPKVWVTEGRVAELKEPGK